MSINLTTKQLEVLQLIADGMSSKEIAKTLGNSKKTIESLRERLLLKFHAKNAPNLIYCAFKSKVFKA